MRLLISAFLVLNSLSLTAQDFEQLNNTRIQTNKTGMLILGGWGGVNIAGGLTGYAIAKDTEWKSFHGMNAIWGTVNGVIALGGYMGARKELKKDFNENEAYARYQSNKKLYLVNAGLDIVYIGSGIALCAYSNRFNNPDMWSGFGRSFVFQGIGLLVFDCAMYAGHQQHNKKWVKAVSGIGFTGNGISYVYRF